MTKKVFVACTTWAERYKVNRIVSRYEYHHFFMVMVFLFVIQDQRLPNYVIIIRFVHRGPRVKEGKKGKRIVNEGIILLGSTGSHFSLKLYSAFDVNIKMYIILAHTLAHRYIMLRKLCRRVGGLHSKCHKSCSFAKASS